MSNKFIQKEKINYFFLQEIYFNNPNKQTNKQTAIEKIAMDIFIYNERLIRLANSA